MHPHIWTVPGINYRIESYGLTIAVGIVLAIWISLRRAKRVGADPSTITSIAIIGVVFGIIGCRAMHFLHHEGAQLRSGEIGLGDVVTATSGGEIVGGIVLAVVSVIVYLAWRKRPIGAYLDIMFPPMILAMGIGRVGCFMFGCCWGGTCELPSGDKGLPWAVRFPYGSPPFERAWLDERIELDETLRWHLPKIAQTTPIPRDVLNNLTIDGDEALARFAISAERAAASRRNDPDSPETKRLTDELNQASAALGRKAASAEIFAVLHLRDLRDRGIDTTWTQLRAYAAGLHSRWLHPAQLYDAVSLGLAFVVLSAIFYRRKRAGMVVAWGMMLYAVNRFLQEMVRGDNPHDTLGLTISQFMSLLILAGGVVLALILLRKPAARALTAPQQPA